jgi:hypothetical protein
MKHASTRAVFDHWNRRRGLRWAPARSDINPGDIRHVLGDTFMLAADFVDGIRFRLAGTRVCALFAREIKGEPFNGLWSKASREQLDNLLGAVLSEYVGVVAGVLGRTQDGTETELELLLLPLVLEGHSRVRALGALAPLAPPYWLGERAMSELDLRTFRHVGAEQSNSGHPRFRSAFAEPQMSTVSSFTAAAVVPTDKPAGPPIINDSLIGSMTGQPISTPYLSLFH